MTYREASRGARVDPHVLYMLEVVGGGDLHGHVFLLLGVIVEQVREGLGQSTEKAWPARLIA